MDQTSNPEKLRERLNRDINDIEAAVSLGNFFYDKGEAAQAILYYRAALDIDPDKPAVRTDLGAMYWRNGNIGFAEHAFREVIARDPGFGQAYVNLGLLLQLERSDVTGARSVWQQLIAVNPDHAVAGRARELLQETALKVNH